MNPLLSRSVLIESQNSWSLITAVLSGLSAFDQSHSISKFKVAVPHSEKRRFDKKENSGYGRFDKFLQ